MSIKLMTAVWERADLSSTQKLVLLALADWANDEGLCWPSINRLAVKASLTSRGVQKSIRSLEDMGFIRREEVTGKGNRYWISIPANEVHPCTAFTPPLNVVHPTPERGSDNTPYTHQDTPKDITALPDWLPIDAWNGWLDMRKQRKKPLTDRATSRAINKLEAMRDAGQDITEVLDRSTMNGWTDLYEIKEKAIGTNRTNKDGVSAALDEMLGIGRPAQPIKRRPLEIFDAKPVAAIAGPDTVQR
jgi:hypothetical protein